MGDFNLLFLVSMGVVAFLYASVGHGGASGYLALMVLWAFSPLVMKPIALVLNVLVSLLAFIQFYGKGFFDAKIFGWFALGSLPAAFLGGYVVLQDLIFKQILGVLLLVSVYFLWRKQSVQASETHPFYWPWALVAGVFIGLISGMLGIGGGILLSPLLVFLRWAPIKQIAGISALFIFVNSLAGLAGWWVKGGVLPEGMFALSVFVVIGGLGGAMVGARYFSPLIVKRMLGVVLLIASAKLFIS